MTEGKQWSGVLKHLAFMDNLAGQNGLSTWGADDDGWWKFDLPFLNRRQVVYNYTADPDKNPNAPKTGGRAWEAELPGPALGLPPFVELKLYAQEKTPDIGVLIGGKIELSFEKLIEKLGVGLIANRRVQRVLGAHWGRLFPIFDNLAKNAPAIEISGAIGFGAGISLRKNSPSIPYVRLLTTAEMNFNPNIFNGVRFLGSAARAVKVHEIDMTGGRGGGRSWQISSPANIPTRM